MSWKNKPPLSLKERLDRVTSAGLKDSPVELDPRVSQLETIDKRVERILSIVDRKDVKANEMLFFVMYDIESTKVRNQVAKYLIRQGCHRIQKSIFLASISNDVFQKIRSDLAEIQSFYKNEDSILLVPISSDYLQSMKVIGKNINIDIITHKRNTLFF